jgi:hypothetical protein
MSARATSLARPTQAIPLLGGLVLAVALGWLVTRADIRQAPGLLVESLLAIVALVCSWRWRWGAYVVVVYVSVEGLATSALYPMTATLFFTDVLIAATYIGFLLMVGRRQEHWPAQRLVWWPLAALAGLCAVEALNPSGVDPQVTLVGIRVLLFYTPLYVIGVALGRDPTVLQRMVRLFLYTSLPITLFGIYEWLSGPQAIAALGPGFARSIWIIGPEASGRPIFRPASTFTFVGHYGAYLLFAGILAFAVLHLPLRLCERILLVGVFLSAMVAIVVEAQRTTWVLLPIAVAGIYLVHRDGRGLLRALPVLAGGLAVAALVGGSVLSNRLPLLVGSLDVYGNRLSGTAGGAFANTNLFTLEAVIGHGTGTALGAIRYVTGGVVPSAFESGWFIPFFMFGILGLAVYAWLYGAVTVETWRGCRRLSADERWLGAALFCFLFLTAAVNGPITTPPTNVYFWLFGGLLASRGLTSGGAQ